MGHLDMTIVFTDEELRFLKEEFALSPEQADALSEDELLGIGDECFDIELEGELRDGSKMPDRCGAAAGIVSKVNELF